MILLNFSHPLSAAQRSQIEALTGQAIAVLHDLPVQFDVQQPFEPQLTELLQRVQQHSRMRLQRMAAWFERAEGAEAIADFYRKLLQTELSSQKALVQLGWGAGWDAKTFSTHLQADTALFERIMKEYKLQHRSRSALPRKQGDPFPQSRRVAVSVAKGNKPAAPFGWVLLEWKRIR